MVAKPPDEDKKYVMLHPLSLTVTEISDARIVVEHLEVEGIVDIKLSQEMVDQLHDLLTREKNKPTRLPLFSFSMRAQVVRRA